MAYKDLQTFINEIDSRGQLKSIDVSVLSELEITEIADRISKANGPALLFKNVKNSKYPLLINAMGSYDRMSIGLGVENLDDIGDEIDKYLDLSNYLSVKKLIKSIPRLFRLLHVFPIKSKLKGKCQQVIEKQVDLNALPVLKCWPEDGGKFITLPLVFTKDIKSKQQNVGMYRLQILDEKSTGMHWHKHKDGSEIYKGYKDNKQKMPVSVALGCDPSITYAATAPLPKMIDEMMLAGWLRKSNVKMVKCITNDIYVPSNAEIILEGYVDPAEELVLEGPFGDHTGYYSLADYYPKFHVTCITHKKNAIYPATIVGKPPMEDCYMAKATERIFLPMLKMIMPELVDLNLPFEGVFHNCAIVSVKNKYPGCAHKIMNAIWGIGQMMYTKLIVVVDEEVNVQNLNEVKDAVLRNVINKENLVFSDGPLDALDHSSNNAMYGSRLGVDATTNINIEEQDKTNDSYKFIIIKKEKPYQGKETLKEFFKTNPEKFVIVVDDVNNPKDISTIIWKLFNNIDAKRDIIIIDDKIGIDATKKLKSEGLTRDWPNDIEMSEEIKQYVNERWDEYGID
ncbi:4-hydroxy-3-polyprenylbenzoate decarboxylase [Sedimentibacter acidaminivorans]|jgi:4-hydroxy-3-polyprenylbenzoate decarboxylase|uniref:4-hydroxy-3-polyprenylbenzoate decarboxylase n=1 Tax=Sedimentibacter acidaminivorans TaxID=913099 RepID=A0ABS4GHI8_9FIRM|nr:menaquinone biosynthesis decarboxylase [Sedimentibacter acidaminivorans]MBP1927153.1 4-hydroxy-3-polyprenylbenzoate decarboxylase [Sedimentibacter acidaminivorans]